ncbi:hypothetical protein TRFO_12615 [Tritrichomonas foetus]|uniref:Uncharacterized protein n=1 Tax=Tritrichomonas foetus TaxID=1144522 RepID=A0A1J4L0R8_9EUKA|nr:hypothetical protein TRFO_12615 [Tritrichomonas foetus]|eukprot:OHT17103.1 hypothetical protein TRFO_12615 [Tritrichomonas foetus]
MSSQQEEEIQLLRKFVCGLYAELKQSEQIIKTLSNDYNPTVQEELDKKDAEINDLIEKLKKTEETLQQADNLITKWHEERIEYKARYDSMNESLRQLMPNE